MQICSLLQVRAIDRSVSGKKIIKELCYKGEEREREREREREIYGRGETRINYREDVRREKIKGRDKKRESLPWERACFPKKIFGKQPVENKFYFY